MSDIASTSNRDKAEGVAIYSDGTYLQNNQGWHAEDSAWKAERIAKILSNNSIRPATVGEVGCGAGEILRKLSEAFTDTFFTGYDISPQAIDLSRSRETGRVKYVQGNLLDEDVFFDCLLCIDVFEHVEDYFGFIRALKSKATYKVFHIPLDVSVQAVLRSTMMLGRESVGHIHYFTRESALATLVDCGYEVIDCFYTTTYSNPGSRRIKTLRGKLAMLPRTIAFNISPPMAARILGGFSLMVLAK